MKKYFLCLLFSLQLLSVQSQTVFVPLHMRTDLLLHENKVWKDLSTVIIHSKKPSFSWQTDTSVKQVTAYTILVASSPTLLENGKADYWDSKKIISNQTHTTYKGKALEPSKKYYWKVQVWNEKGKPSYFSETVSFQLSDLSTLDTISHYPLTYDLQSPVTISPPKPGYYFFDFGKDAFSQLQLHLNASKDDTVTIEAGETSQKEYIVYNNPSRNIRYIKIELPVKKGEHDYAITWPVDAKRNSRNPIQMPEEIGEVFPFRYVSAKMLSGNSDYLYVTRRAVHYPFDEYASSFQSSNSVLNEVWDLCKYSVKATSFSGFYLDGDRERLPYEADAVINQLSHYASDAEYSIARRTLAYLIYHPTWPTEWTLQISILAWNDYMYTGDDTFLKKYYEEIKAKTLLQLADDNRLISTINGKQKDAFIQSLHNKLIFDGKRGLVDIVDWPQSGVTGTEKEYGGETDGFVFTKYNAVVNAYYYNALGLMQKMAAALNKDRDAAMFAEKAKQVFNAYQTVFVDPVNGLVKDGDQTNHSSLHGNMFALDFGLIPEKNVPAVTAFIKSRRMACSVYGSQFLLDGLFDHGEDEYALSLMSATTQRSWYNMIRTGSTITLEAWDKMYKPNLDLNHAWGSAPANLIIRKMMGVEPLTPGFETIKIKPGIGNLSFAKMRTSTLKGEVAISFQKNKEIENWDITVPGAATANVYLPSHAKDEKIFIDGKQISLQKQKGFWVIEKLPSGTHTIQIK